MLTNQPSELTEDVGLAHEGIFSGRFVALRTLQAQHGGSVRAETAAAEGQAPRGAMAPTGAREHRRPRVRPSPATHTILAQLKAGESVNQTRLLTKTVVHVYRRAQPLSHALFWHQFDKTLSETLFFPPFMHPGFRG